MYILKIMFLKIQIFLIFQIFQRFFDLNQNKEIPETIISKNSPFLIFKLRYNISKFINILKEKTGYKFIHNLNLNQFNKINDLSYEVTEKEKIKTRNTLS